MYAPVLLAEIGKLEITFTGAKRTNDRNAHRLKSYICYASMIVDSCVCVFAATLYICIIPYHMYGIESGNLKSVYYLANVCIACT